MIGQIKTHHIATSIFIIYIIVWLWLFYVAYYDFTHYGDGETIGMSVFGATLLLFIPYFAINVLLSKVYKLSQFYYHLALLSIIPIPLILIWVGILQYIF